MRVVHVRMSFVRNWWMLALRSLMAVLFGVAAFVWLRPVPAVLQGRFGAFTLIDGHFAALPPEGPIGTVAGVITLLWPVTRRVLILSDLAAGQAMGTGILEILASMWIGHGWPLMLDGIMLALLGVVLVLLPITNASALLWLCGAYVVVSGMTLLCFAFRLKRLMVVRKKA